MTHLLFFAGFLLLPLFGLWTWRLEAVRRMDLAGRIAVAGAAGAVVAGVVMALMSLVHVPWSRTSLFVILGLICGGQAILPVLSTRTDRIVCPPQKHVRIAILAFLALTCYGLITARESAGDLHFFWGPKGIHFHHAGGVDVSFLANKTNPNSDYPPLLPLLYAWSMTVARQFSWFAAVLATALFLFGAAAILRACSRDDLGTLLFVAAMSWTVAIGYAAGGADPPLVLFEMLALAALTFIDDERSRDVLAAIGLAGAAWTKIEGSTFVIAVVLALILTRRGVKRTLLLATPAFVLMIGWVAFLLYHRLIFGYGGAKMAIYPGSLPKTIELVAKAGLFELYGLPWLIPIVLLFFGNIRRALFPLLVTVLTLCATVFFYIHIEDATWWIAASAPRVLLTPLTALIVASVAVLQSRADGVVPQGKEAEGSGREADRDPGGAVGQV